jgi:DNA repair protein RecO (recombination protein O)
VTGAAEDLVYVSPSSGRAVSRGGAGAYADRLLPLPPFLLGRGTADPAQLAAGLRLTGTFLRRHLFDASERSLPEARDRLLARLLRSTEQ